MLWDDIQVLIENGTGQECRVDGRFTPTICRLLMTAKQAEINEVVRCITPSISNSFTAGTKAYALPNDFMDFVRISVTDIGPLAQADTVPVYATDPTGAPAQFTLDGNFLSIMPVPDGTYSYSLVYAAYEPEYAFKVTHAAGNNSSTAATFTTTATAMTLTITGGTDAGTSTITFAHDTTDTVAEVVAKINALGKGFTATIHPTQITTRAMSGVDARSSVNIEGKTDYVFFNPRIDARAHRIIAEGVIHDFKYKDRELSASELKGTKYYGMLDRFKKEWQIRNERGRNQTVKDAYQAEVGRVGSNMRVWIP